MQWPRDAARWVAALATALSGILVFTFLARRFGAESNDWWFLAKVAAAAVIAFGVAATIRFSVAPLLKGEPTTPPAPVDPDAALRGRIAPLVLMLGGAAIVVLAMTLIICFSVLSLTNDELKSKLDTVLSGIFTATLPVFATWVGTVIAFYFTNESYRQAAQATREAATGFAAASPNVSVRMIPYEKIARIERPRAEVRGVPLKDVVDKMKEPVTRVIVFDATRQPVFILRQKLIPKDWLADPSGKTVDDYLKAGGGENADDAIQFGYVPQTATLEAARTALRESKSVDIFVTATGQKTEPVVGWLTDDLLKS